jgi:uncharacterized protein (TIGR00251 family)
MTNVLLNCHVTPKSKSPSITVDDTSGVAIVNVKVSAPPDKGKANKAVLESLADKLRVKSSKLSIQSGATSRSKVVQLETDADLPTILARIRYFLLTAISTLECPDVQSTGPPSPHLRVAPRPSLKRSLSRRSQPRRRRSSRPRSSLMTSPKTRDALSET